jgi:putative nucleotidyltransferase with HDIG domain
MQKENIEMSEPLTTGDNFPRRPLVVVVDDEPSILMSLRSLFHRQPVEFQEFSDCQEALKYLVNRTPDIIISDMRMPEMNGITFLSEVAKISPTSARFLLSGYEDKGIIIDAIAGGIAQLYILKPWEDQELLRIVQNTLSARELLRERNLQAIIQNITMLPSPPHIQTKLRQVFSKQSPSIREVAVEVEQDPAMVARIMRIANSVFIGARNPITTIQDAVTFIGIDYLQSMILGMEMFRHFEKSGDAETLKQLEELWHHAVNRAQIGRIVAEQWKEFQQPQLAYITCLLLDIGLMVRMQLVPDQHNHFIRLASDLHLPLDRAEPKVFDIDHAEVGAALLRFWNFPEQISEAVAHHHSPDTDDTLTKIVQVADAVESLDDRQAHDTSLNQIIEEYRTKKSSMKFIDPS